MQHLEFRISNNALTPTRAHPSDAGLDLRASTNYDIFPHEKALVNTGVQVRIPVGYVGLLIARSSLQKQGLMLANNVGVIDASYRGNLFVPLLNLSEEVQLIKYATKFAQLLIVPVALPEVRAVYEDDDKWESTSRGVGGFGSTGL